MSIPFYPEPINEPLNSSEKAILRKMVNENLDEGATNAEIEQLTAKFALKIYHARLKRLKNPTLDDLLEKPHYRLGLAFVNLFRQHAAIFLAALIGLMYWLGLF